MARPAVKVEIAFDSDYSTAAASRTWTDVTDYVLTAAGVNIVHGRRDERSQAEPNTLSLTLDNSDGRFSPGLATSPYYPNVKLGRPLRVAVNLCTTGDYGTFEANATGWVGQSATIARTTAQAHSGSASLSVTATSAANIGVVSSAATVNALVPVVPSTSYRASAWVRTAVTGRSVDARINWFDSGGTLISTDNGTNVTDSTTWQQVTVTATSPSTAAYARVQVVWVSAALSEVHYVDDVRFDVDRFVGYVDEWPLEWPGVVTTYATSSITATSRMARMGLSDKLRSVVEQEILRDSPSAYYALGEAAGATRAIDSSGNSAAPLVTRPEWSYTDYPQTDPTFGTATGPGTDGLTAVQFAGVAATSVPKLLTALYETSTAMVGVEFYFSATNTGAVSTSLMAAGIFSTGSSAVSASLQSTGELLIQVPGAASITTTATYLDGSTYHVHIRQDGANVRLYVDGAEVGSTAGTMGNYTAIQIGHSSDTATVAIAHLAIFGTALTAARIADHADAGLTGFSAETAEARLARYAAYANVPTAEQSIDTAADTPMAHIDTTGQGAVELMQKVAETDGGVLYDAPDGTLTYASRGVRYNATAALTLDHDAGEVQATYTPKLDRSALINKVTATISDGTYSATAEDTTSTGEYGVHSSSDLELHTTDTNEAHAAAWWRVNTYGEPAARAPQLGVELAALSTTRQVALLAVGVGDKVTVTNLPSQSDSSTKSFFVEGYAETITDSLHRIEFNVSPADGFEVWEIEHATYGQYDAYPLAY